MTTKLFFIGALLLMLTTAKTFGQQLKSEEWEVNMDKWEEQQMDFFGKTQIIYVGILKVKNGKKKYGEYRFYFPEMDGKLRHLTIRDMNDKILEPRLYYNSEDNSFTYNKGTDKEMKEVTMRSENTKDIVLSGMLIWLEQKK
jgi:hypothetical protein